MDVEREKGEMGVKYYGIAEDVEKTVCGPGSGPEEMWGAVIDWEPTQPHFWPFEDSGLSLSWSLCNNQGCLLIES